MLESDPNSRVPHSIWCQIRWPVIALVLVVVAWVLVVTNEPDPPPEPPEPPPITTSPSDVRERFFAQHIEPHIAAHERANRAAAERALQRIDEMFSRYQRGVAPFAEDITSIGTRFGIMWRMPVDWWQKEERVKTYVQEIFERHLFSKDQLENDLAAILSAFGEDLQANRNRLLTSARQALDLPEAPSLTIPHLAEYQARVETMMLQFSQERAERSVYYGLATLVASETAAVAATQIVLHVVANTASAAAAPTAAGSASSTATAASTGGTVGMVGGPAGIAIGVSVGLIIGIAVDWWMTDRFEARLTKDLTAYISKLRSSFIDGGGEHTGFRRSIHEFVDDLNATESVILHQTLLES